MRAVWRVLWPYLALVAVVLAANSLSLLVTDPNPLLQRSGLPVVEGGHKLVEGRNTIDSNDGFTTQTLGVQSARMLLSGELPLWNHDEGLGQPLAAGMQAASLFPYTLLLLLPRGFVLLHLALELTAGVGMLLLLRRLGLGRTASLVGASLFALNGTFAWLANAVVNPIAFLPWLLLGIELARASEGWRRLRGWWLVALSIALSLYAGFPEVAYLNGLLALVWGLARLAGARRRMPYLVSVAAGGIAGLALALPILVLFLGYLPDADLLNHEEGFSAISLQPESLPMLVAPYLLGPIAAWSAQDESGAVRHFWAYVGGYLTAASAALGAFALVVRRGDGRRVLVWALGGWTVLALGRIYGIPGLAQVVDLIPGMSAIQAMRYLAPSVEAAVAVLAAIGLDALRRGAIGVRRRVVTAVASGIALLALLIAGLVHAGGLAGTADGFRAWAVFAAVVLASALIAVVIAATGARRVRGVLPAVVVLEAIALFVVPQLSAPERPTRVDTRVTDYLAEHLGDGRVFGLGVLLPNYGSYFGLASLNENNLPVPRRWAEVLQQDLVPSEDPVRFDGAYPDRATAKAEVLQHLDAFRALGVRYLLAPSGAFTPDELAANRLDVAFETDRVTIVAVEGAADYFSAKGCAVAAEDWQRVAVDCASASTLKRLELAMPGWAAEVDGTRTAVAGDGTVQTIALPAGRHEVSFRYRPPHLAAALVVAGVTAVAAIAFAAAQAVARRRRER